MISGTTSSSLANLVDDCLIEIFSWLPLFDLMSVAETSIRFGSIARTVFKLNHHNFNTAALLHHNHFSLIDVRRLLRIFGSVITDIVLGKEYEGHEEALLNLVIKYCSKTVESLRLQLGWECISQGIDIPHVKLCHLKKLIIADRDVPPNIGYLYSECSELTELSTHSTDILQFDFPKLTKLYLDVWTPTRNDEAYIELKHCCDDDSKKMKRIRFLLQIDYYINDEFVRPLDNLSRFENLTVFRMLCLHECISTVIHRMACTETLECLELACLKVDDVLLAGVERFPNLHSVKLHVITTPSRNAKFDITSRAVVNLVKSLARLAVLSLEATSFILERDVYEDLVEICQNRKEKVKLCIFNAQNGQGDIPQAHEIDNRDYVEVQISKEEW